MKKILTFISALILLNVCSCKKEQTSPSSPEAVSESEQKTTLVVATTIKGTEQSKNLINSKMSCDVEIKYYPNSEQTDPSDLLRLDLISGEQIDVVYDITESMIPLIKNGYFTDIYPLLENSESLKKADFLPNILAGLEVDGKLPVICNDWTLNTAVAKTENVGENMQNWTPAQAWEAYKNLPEDSGFLGFAFSKYDLLNYFITRVAVDSVDYAKNTCDFNGDFVEMLENVNNLPPFQETDWENDDFIKNRCLVHETRLFGINSTMSQQLYGYFDGADITFVGYPSTSGKGYITESFAMYGILETSQNKQSGLDFINLMLHDTTINKTMMYSMPITERQLNEQVNATKYSNISVNSPQQIFDSEKAITMSKEAINQAVEYVKNIQFEPYTRNTIYNIVFEECHKCFAGEITPQQCADTLNNRVSLFLSEQS